MSGTIWGVHNDQPQLDLVGNGFVSVAWSEVGDLRQFGEDREALKQRLAALYPDDKPGAIPVWAGVLVRFAYEMQPGDLVIYPYRPDATVSFGRIVGDYEFHADEPLHPNRRKVEWLKTGIPRATFSKSARYEIGSSVTLFKVKNNADEFRAFIESGVVPDPAAAAAAAGPAAAVTADAIITEAAEDEPNAERIETYSRDFVTETLLKKLEGAQFEHFVAGLLTAMGYRTQVTQASGDGGVDVIAHKDPLGLEPPIIKVQCKRTLSSSGGPDVQKLMGTLAPGGQEVGLFVTLGSFAKDAQHIGRTRQDLRLLGGTELVDLIFRYYEDLAPEWKRLLPMRRVWVVDREPEAG